MVNLHTRIRSLLNRWTVLETTPRQKRKLIWRRSHLDCLRDAIRLLEDGAGREDAKGISRHHLRKIQHMAAQGFIELGGAGEPPWNSLKEYDSDRFGPYLGVSGEANAAAAIIAAAERSPKTRALRLSSPLEIGVAHDAERLGSPGELPSGPEEYRAIRLQCLGRILTSTNVGSHLNLRYYARWPVIWIRPAAIEEIVAKAQKNLSEKFTPFLSTPDGRPRPFTVLVNFRQAIPDLSKIDVLRRLTREMRDGRIADPQVHRLGLLAIVPAGKRGAQEALRAMDIARQGGVQDVILEGKIRSAAEDLVTLPGILRYFPSAETEKLLEYAKRNHLRLRIKNNIDLSSMARHVWTGLNQARMMGLELGKYGLHPVTFEEGEDIVEFIQRCFPDWTAAPAFYVDVPTLRGTQVFTASQMPGVLREWLKMVASHHVKVVLIDTVEKTKGRKLVKTHVKDRQGILTLEEIRDLTEFAQKHGVKALWAGGIGFRQAHQLGQLGVFGIYVTTAVTEPRPISSDHNADPGLPAERLPVKEKIAWVKTLIEAGFLARRMPNRGGTAAVLSRLAEEFLTLLESGTASTARIHAGYRSLETATLAGWKAYCPPRQRK